MTLKQIKGAVEAHYNIKDISAKGRTKTAVEAKRMAVWYAREIGYRPCEIQKAYGIRHDTQFHHWSKMNDLIFIGNISEVNDAWTIFGLDVTKGQSKAKLERIHKRLDDTLMACPESSLEELYERIELMVRAYNHKNVPQEAEIITANAIAIED